jgi:hypothetical protein
VAFVLAIEPDAEQVETLQERLAHDLAGHELLVVASNQEALEAIDRRVPDLVLVHAFFPPGDERALMARLSTAGAVPPPTLAIPFFDSTPAPACTEPRWFYWRQRSTADVRTEADGARLFAEQLRAYLEDCKGIDGPIECGSPQPAADFPLTSAGIDVARNQPDSVGSGVDDVAVTDVAVVDVAIADLTVADARTGDADERPPESFELIPAEAESAGGAPALIVRQLAGSLAGGATAAGARDPWSAQAQDATLQTPTSDSACMPPDSTDPEHASSTQEGRPRGPQPGVFSDRSGRWWNARRARGVRTVAAAALLVLGMMGRVRWTIPPRTDLARAAAADDRERQTERPKPVGLRTGQLEVSSDPTGATVVVDGRACGETPLTIGDLAPGAHTVTLERGGSIVRRSITVRSGRMASVHASIYPGWLAVFAPFELDVFDNGHALNLDEHDQAMLPAGRHDIRLVNRGLGYREDRVVEIQPGKLTVASVELPTSRITVTSTPSAEVWIDGTRVGETPLVDQPVGIGTREIVLRNAAFNDRRLTVTVTVEPARIDVDLTRP